MGPFSVAGGHVDTVSLHGASFFYLEAFFQVIKNHFASEFIYNRYKLEKTCGVIEYDPSGGITKVAEPVGVIAGAGH